MGEKCPFARCNFPPLLYTYTQYIRRDVRVTNVLGIATNSRASSRVQRVVLGRSPDRSETGGDRVPGAWQAVDR